MNLDDTLAPFLAFFSDGIGAVIAQVARVIFDLLYPANSGPAGPVEIPN